MSTESERVAVRLGLTERVIRQLRARGHLDGLELDERRARERLWRAHVAFLRAGATARGRTGETTSSSD